MTLPHLTLPLETEVQDDLVLPLDFTAFSRALLMSELTLDGPFTEFANRWVKIGFPI